MIFWAWAGFVIAGKEDWRRGVIAAAVMLIVFGPVVLWTAREPTRKIRSCHD